jgi:hypothetical protein
MVKMATNLLDMATFLHNSAKRQRNGLLRNIFSCNSVGNQEISLKKAILNYGTKNKAENGIKAEQVNNKNMFWPSF